MKRPDECCPHCGCDVSDSLWDWAQSISRSGWFAFKCYECGETIHGMKVTTYELHKERPKP